MEKRLLEEQARAAIAQQARIEAEVKCHVAKRERNIYRILTRRWRTQLHTAFEQTTNTAATNTNTANNESSREVDKIL